MGSCYKRMTWYVYIKLFFFCLFTKLLLNALLLLWQPHDLFHFSRYHLFYHETYLRRSITWCHWSCHCLDDEPHRCLECQLGNKLCFHLPKALLSIEVGELLMNKDENERVGEWERGFVWNDVLTTAAPAIDLSLKESFNTKWIFSSKLTFYFLR